MALVDVPFASVSRPSIGLTQLRSRLHNMHPDITVDLVYANMRFARRIGLSRYEEFQGSPHYGFGAGDWMFRHLAFPSASDNATDYFDRYYARLKGEGRAEKSWAKVLEAKSQLAAILDEVIADFDLASADLVGFTSMFQQNMAAFAFARRIKELNPGVITAMGGANCEGVMGRAIAREVAAIDMVFSGPALVSFPEVVGLLSSGELALENLGQSVRGVMSNRQRPRIPLWKGTLDDHGGGLAVAAEAEVQVGEQWDIDDPEMQLDYESFLEAVTTELDDAIAPTLLVETSRGCWWGERNHCTFCGLNGTSLKSSDMGPKRAVETFESLFRYEGRARKISAVDNILPKAFFTEVLPKLATPPSMHIFYELKANVTDDQMTTLKAAGVDEIQPGIEALATSILRLMDKGATAFQNLRLLRRCAELDINPIWPILIGVPLEDPSVYETYRTLLPTLVHLPPPASVVPIAFHRYSVYHDRPDDFGLRLAPADFYSYLYPWGPAAINDIAYFFVDRNLAAPYQFHLVWWYPKLAELTQQWADRWLEDRSSPSFPRLEIRRDGDVPVVFDSRSGTPEVTRLTPLEERLLGGMRGPTRVSQLVSALSEEPDGIAAAIALLDQRSWLFREGQHVMSIVVDPGNLPNRVPTSPRL